MNHKKFIKYRYDKTAEFYDRRYREIQELKYKIILEKISIKHNQIILDIGSGTGNSFLYLDKYNSFKYGVDFSIESLKTYQRKPSRENSAQLICADIEFLPFKKDIFEIIFVVTVLQNLPDPRNSLKEIKQICQHGGLIVLSLLKKKFGMERIKQILDEVDLLPLDIIDDEKCEDIIIFIENRKS